MLKLKKVSLFLLLFAGIISVDFVLTANFYIIINKIIWPVKAAYAVDGLKMGALVINEITWMGTAASYNDEWIELYNNTDSRLNLEGWVLKAADGSPEINLTKELLARSFYLLERTNDDTVPQIQADQTYSGVLNNKGEILELYDNLGNLIDQINCSSGWFAGDNLTKQTMERKSPALPGDEFDNWQTSQNPGGTAKAKNSIFTEISQSELPQPESPPTQEPQVEPALSAVAPPTTQPTTTPTTTEEFHEVKLSKIWVILIAGVVAVVSGGVILTLKNKLKMS